MILYLILPYFDRHIDFDDDSVICGIDSGSIFALKNNIKLDYALGDFDSISDDELNLLLSTDAKILKLKPEKDETDTEYAIKYFSDYQKIVICGGIKGKRIDHLIANINLLKKYKNLYIFDNDSLITNICNFNDVSNENYYYVSFFLEENSTLSLEGFKYNLDNYKFNKFDNLCISNEIIADPFVKYEGNGIVIFSKLDNINLQK